MKKSVVTILLVLMMAGPARADEARHLPGNVTVKPSEHTSVRNLPGNVHVVSRNDRNDSIVVRNNGNTVRIYMDRDAAGRIRDSLRNGGNLYVRSPYGYAPYNYNADESAAYTAGYIAGQSGR